MLLLRLVLGGLFIFAASMKLYDLQAFNDSVRAFELVPDNADHAIVLLTFIVPWIELLCGTLLLLGLWTRSAALVLSFLLICFIGGVFSVLARGMHVTCGCFGKFEVPCTGPIGTCHIVRNTVLLAVSVVVLWKGPGSLALDREPR